jgi:hypothetical protein
MVIDKISNIFQQEKKYVKKLLKRINNYAQLTFVFVGILIIKKNSC